jgi:hypothetical protein
LAKDEELPARFLGQMKEVPINLRFESSTAALTKLTNFGVVVWASVLAVKVEAKYQYQLPKYLH